MWFLYFLWIWNLDSFLISSEVARGTVLLVPVTSMIENETWHGPPIHISDFEPYFYSNYKLFFYSNRASRKKNEFYRHGSPNLDSDSTIRLW